MKQAVQLASLSAANIGVAFLSQWYVLTQLGPGPETDALFAGMTLPQLVLTVISGSLMHVLVPLLANEEEKNLRHDAWGFLILVGGVFSLLASVLYLSAQWWVPITVPGFSDAGVALTVELTRIQLIGMVFSAINGVQWAAYHARQQFVWAEFIPIVSSGFSLLLLIWALPRYGVISAAWIFTLRMALQTLLLAPGMGWPESLNLHSAHIQQAWKRIKPLLLGAAYFKTDPMVDRFLLSAANSGSLSLYYLAQQIYSVINQVLNKAIAAPLVPLLSKLNMAGEQEIFRRVCRKKLLQVLMMSLFGLAIVVLFGKGLLGLLVGHGNVTASNLDDLWWTMIWLSGVFVGGACGQICATSFYSCGDTVTPMRMAIIPYTIFIPTKATAFYFYGTKGLAITTSIYYLTILLLHLYFLRRKQIL